MRGLGFVQERGLSDGVRDGKLFVAVIDRETDVPVAGDGGVGVGVGEVRDGD